MRKFLPLSVLTLMVAACNSAPPKLKEGLWEVRGQTLEKPAGTKTEFVYQLCRNHALDAAQNAQVRSVQGCNTQLQKQRDGKFISASNCKVGNTLIKSSGVTAFKNGTSTHSETHASYAPPLNGKMEETMTEDQFFLGACPLGMRAGDTLGHDGIVRHHD